ncbi:MAG TPA: class I SAM-dependent methyltransferase [Pyrinomonadaceae bacterium]|jgi:predicted O-methyltransferase YrrM
MIYSEDDAVSHASQRLIELSTEAIVCAGRTKLDDLQIRLGGRFSYPDDLVNLWPGEHYRLLAALIQILNPQLVIEIGTAEGLSALCMLKYLSRNGRIVTFDLVPWAQYPRTCLTEEDFRDGRLRQVVGDLGEDEIFERHAELLSKANLVFIDAAKDGVLERRLIARFEKLRYESKPLFVFDDIRLWNMLSTWRDLRWPKLDLTSFGHWCGTGICEPPITSLDT